ncbi:cytochrome P450 [Stereum hirsutum FP-91666 SS1]|uniref:Cytochrome P450 n=1 Tax=Stereum hirsutum (strain FP-91666) TaxID=721885 RepID=R7RZZ4_STEHR|nr:cytochrome P450 [Stereum hirsutum FP-91666 SS1]EIM80470.1 cytochrome P450 [Stereum hirsutum FP-91666 SS1]
MPSSQEWLTFAEWGKQYGPLVMVEMLGQKMCIINSAEVALDLLDKRSAIYSERPSMVMVKELMGWEFNMGFQSYTPTYRKHRENFTRGFSPKASENYQHLQTREIILCLRKLLENPEKFDEHLRNTIGAVVMMIAFGYETKENDEFVRIAEEAQLAMVSAARPGAYMVDVIPILRYVPEWFPGANFQRVARRGYELAQDLQQKPWVWGMNQYKKGVAKPSFFTSLMEPDGIAVQHSPEKMKVIQKDCAVLYATAADTILASVLTFFLAMLHAPEVVTKAQAELDKVTGGIRLPTFADRPALPYITAIAKESLRWESVIPMGVPHVVKQDDVYKGYFIPAGTTMIPNQWGMSHDDELYSDPMSFRPERFMPGVDGTPPRDPNTIAFGFGRRICPGRFLAEQQLWLQIATTLLCFNIRRTCDEAGNEIIPPRFYSSGMASRPIPFACQITPRNAAYVELIAQSVAALDE